MGKLCQSVLLFFRTEKMESYDAQSLWNNMFKAKNITSADGTLELLAQIWKMRIYTLRNAHHSPPFIPELSMIENVNQILANIFHFSAHLQT